MKILPLTAMAVATSLISGCSQKIDFYEYEGGMINLSQVKVVATSASITVSVSPHRNPGEPDSYERAMYDAHQAFCNEWNPNVGYQGGITSSVPSFQAIKDKLANEVTYEVLDTCKITIGTSATINLDTFTINQESGAFELPKVEESEIAKDKLAAHINGLVSSNVSQPSVWLATYNSLRSRVKI